MGGVFLLSFFQFLFSFFQFLFSFFRQCRAELAGGEVFQGAEACVEFGGGQAALAGGRAQKVRGRTVALARVALDTAGNQVGVGIWPEAHAWHGVGEGPRVRARAITANCRRSLPTTREWRSR